MVSIPILPTMRLVALLVALLLVAGCGSNLFHQKETPADGASFKPVAMRLHPIFTGIKSWQGDAQPDGIEAELEFLDAFDDPAKAAGRVIFELFAYNNKSPDPRGNRLANPWVGSIGTIEEQRTRWNRTSRTYSFQLAFPAINPTETYVLTASFEPVGGSRLFSRTILRGREPVPVSEDRTREPTTAASVTQPAN